MGRALREISHHSTISPSQFNQRKISLMFPKIFQQRKMNPYNWSSSRCSNRPNLIQADRWFHPSRLRVISSDAWLCVTTWLESKTEMVNSSSLDLVKMSYVYLRWQRQRTQRLLDALLTEIQLLLPSRLMDKKRHTRTLSSTILIVHAKWWQG